MKIKKACAVLFIGLSLIFLCQNDCKAQYEQVDKLVENGDKLFEEEKYADAKAEYENAYLMLKAALEQEEGITASTREEKITRKNNIAELRRRLRKLAILKRRAELKHMVVKRKEGIAQKKEAIRKEKEFYKERRAEKKARKEAEKFARIEAERREKELKLAKRQEEIEAKEIKKIAEIEAEREKQEKVAKKIERAKKKQEKIVKKIEDAKEKIMTSLEAKIEAEQAKKLALVEKESEDPVGEKLTRREKALIKKARLREEKLALKRAKALMHRMEKTEALRKKKEQKEAKLKENRRKNAIQKAKLCKTELSKYTIMGKDDMDGSVKRAEKLIKRADKYFEKEMYKEASELYSRGFQILKGKIYY